MTRMLKSAFLASMLPVFSANIPPNISNIYLRLKMLIYRALSKDFATMFNAFATMFNALATIFNVLDTMFKACLWYRL